MQPGDELIEPDTLNFGRDVRDDYCDTCLCSWYFVDDDCECECHDDLNDWADGEDD